MERFGELLSTLRKQKNLSQSIVAKALNVSNTTISKWENEQSYPDIVMAAKIASFYEITCDELLHPTETLEKMNNTGFGENDVCEITASGERNRMTKKVVALVSLASILALASIFIFLKRDYVFVEATNNVVTDVGLAYELVYLCPKDATDQTVMKHAHSIEALWQEGKYEDSYENFLVITYYYSKEDMENPDDYFLQAYFKLDEQEW